MSRPDRQTDLALLRRVIAGLEEDLQADDLLPHLACRRVADARAMLDVVAARHAEASDEDAEWAWAVDHVHDLCAEVVRARVGEHARHVEV
jgi:hypothetical protein